MTAKCITAGSHDDFRTGRRENSDNMPGPIQLPARCTIKLVSLGWKHGHIVINDNELFSWGTGKSYRLGTDSKTDAEIPVRVQIPRDFEFKMIASGDAFSAAISKTGELLAWGHKYAHKPTKINLPSPATYLACGTTSIICSLEDGSLITFDNGESDKNIHQVPGEKFIMTAAGKNHFIALSSSGKVYTWGGDHCGHSSEKTRPELLKVSSVPVCGVYAYQDNSWFVDQNNDVYCFGKNDDGCLGTNSTSSISSPQKVAFDFRGRVIQIACGDNITIVLTDRGTAYAAGSYKDNRTAIDPKANPKVFNQCTLGLSGRITQVACGCYSSAFVINGDPPPNQRALKSFDLFSIPTTPTKYYDQNGDLVMVSPEPKKIEATGLRLEDIIIYPDKTKAKVVGMTANGRIAVMTDNLTLNSIPYTNFDEVITKIRLIKRDDHKLLSFKMNENGKEETIQIDISDSELFKFHGLKTQDLISDDVRICGARGTTLFANTKDLTKVFKLDSINTYTTVIRNNKTIYKRKFDDGENRFVETNENPDETLRFDDNYGIGKYIGKVHSYFCFEFLGNCGLLTLVDHDLPVVRDVENGTRTLDTFVEDQGSYQSITLNISPSNDLYPLDYVKTSKGFGSIAGFANGKVAVNLENNIAFRGAVSLIDFSDITPILRFSAPLTINEMSANTDDFKDFNLFPSDDIELDGKKMTVVGIKEGKIFAEENGTMKQIDPSKANLIKRHFVYRRVKLNENLYCFCTTYNQISPELVPYGEKKPYGTVLGLKNHSTLFVKDNENHIVNTAFTLPKI